jgi:hypothetical protein
LWPVQQVIIWSPDNSPMAGAVDMRQPDTD